MGVFSSGGVGIDLGSANVTIFLESEGVVLREPSYVLASRDDPGQRARLRARRPADAGAHAARGDARLSGDGRRGGRYRDDHHAFARAFRKGHRPPPGAGPHPRGGLHGPGRDARGARRAGGSRQGPRRAPRRARPLHGGGGGGRGRVHRRAQGRDGGQHRRLHHGSGRPLRETASSPRARCAPAAWRWTRPSSATYATKRGWSSASARRRI